LQHLFHFIAHETTPKDCELIVQSRVMQVGPSHLSPSAGPAADNDADVEGNRMLERCNKFVNECRPPTCP